MIVSEQWAMKVAQNKKELREAGIEPATSCV